MNKKLYYFSILVIICFVCISPYVVAVTNEAHSTFEGYSNGATPAGITSSGCGTYTIDTSVNPPGPNTKSLKVTGTSNCAGEFLTVAKGDSTQFQVMTPSTGSFPYTLLCITSTAFHCSAFASGTFDDYVSMTSDDLGNIEVRANTGTSLDDTHTPLCSGNNCPMLKDVWYTITIAYTDINGGTGNCRVADSCTIDFSVCSTICNTKSLIITLAGDSTCVGKGATPYSGCMFDGTMNNLMIGNINGGTGVYYNDFRVTGGSLQTGPDNNADFTTSALVGSSSTNCQDTNSMFSCIVSFMATGYSISEDMSSLFVVFVLILVIVIALYRMTGSAVSIPIGAFLGLGLGIGIGLLPIWVEMTIVLLLIFVVGRMLFGGEGGEES